MPVRFSPVPMADPVDRVMVTVTFLRMARPPDYAPRALPPELSVAHAREPTVAFYRYLYNTVGGAYLWWLRRVAADADIARLLANPSISIHVLYRAGAPAGFYELERRPGAEINLSYFGLMPHAVGQGLGTGFLHHAIGTAWAERPNAMTVNTCNADNPRALPGYLAAGFTPVREVRELWSVPRRLGLSVPKQLKVS